MALRLKALSPWLSTAERADPTSLMASLSPAWAALVNQKMDAGV
jgi:hypothetical protein